MGGAILRTAPRYSDRSKDDKGLKKVRKSDNASRRRLGRSDSSSEFSSRHIRKGLRSKHSLGSDLRTVSSSGSESSRRRVPKHYKGRGTLKQSRGRSSYRGRSPVSHRSDSSDTRSSASTQYTSNLLSVDTAENSESKLQDIGRVVNASDLTDYSDHFTLDSQELEEFEKFVQKHERRGLRQIYSEDSGNSAFYSLAESSSKVKAELSEDATSGIVAVNSSELAKRGIGHCAYKACFCIDDESLQGSYGGLRDGEVLIAASSLSTHESVDFSERSERSYGASSRSQSRHIERMESRMDSPCTTSAGMENELRNFQETPSDVFCFWFWCMSPVEGELSSRDEDDRDLDIHGQDTNASGRSRAVVWQRSEDETSNTTTEEFLSEERAAAIAQAARDINILNSFRPQSKASDDCVDKPSCLGGDSLSSSENEDVPISKETVTEVDKSDTSQISVSQSIFVLGDNAVISGVSEVEAGNGDTAFLIFLSVSRKELSEDGKAAVARRRFQGHPCCHRGTNMAASSETEQNLSFEAPITIVADEKGQVTERPRLIIEDTALNYLDNLCQLSEASYYCLDKKTKRKITRVVQAHQANYSSYLEVAPTFSLESQGSHVTSSSDETASQYMFCMRAAEWLGEHTTPEDSFTLQSPSAEETPKLEEFPQMAATFTVAIEDALSLQRKRTTELNAAKERRSTKLAALQPWLTKQPTTVGKAEIDKYLDGSPSALKAGSSAASSCDTERAEVDQYIESLATVSQQFSQEEKPSMYLRGMSRSAVKAHAMVHAGKKPRCTSKLSEFTKATTHESNLHLTDTGDSSEVAPLPYTSAAPKEATEATLLETQDLHRPVNQRRSEKVEKLQASRIKNKAGKMKASLRSPITTTPTTAQTPPMAPTSATGLAAPPPTTTVLIGPGENSTSSRMSIRSFGRRSSGEDSLKGTKFIGENGKSESSSNHSACINTYLMFLEEKDGPGTDHHRVVDKVPPTATSPRDGNRVPPQVGKNLDEEWHAALVRGGNVVHGAREILSRYAEGSFGGADGVVSNDVSAADGVEQREELERQYQQETEEPEREQVSNLLPFDRHELPTTSTKPLPVPAFVPRISPEMLEHISSSKDSKMISKDEMDADERRLQSYAERSRLSQQLLLADNSTRHQGRMLDHRGIGTTTGSGPFVQFEKSQIYQTGLSRQQRRTTNASVSSSTSGSNDEFFDAVSRNSSSLSVDE